MNQSRVAGQSLPIPSRFTSRILQTHYFALINEN